MFDESTSPQTAAGMGGGPEEEVAEDAEIDDESEQVPAPASGMGGGGGEDAAGEAGAVPQEEQLTGEAPEIPEEMMAPEAGREPEVAVDQREGQIREESGLSWTLVEAVLGLTALLTGLAAFLLRKRT
jgi:hypothetical protein